LCEVCPAKIQRAICGRKWRSLLLASP
jgi:hypothetical protein